MRRFWIRMNILYEKLMFFIFLVALLIVSWGLYDAWYVYNKANDDSYLRYKPVPGESVAEDMPITDDMVAWITIDDTNIDYPVMQGDNDYSILYGHHMEHGAMFGALDDFLDKRYLENHSTGTLIVGRDGSKVYDLGVFACVKVNIFDKKALDPEALDVAKELISKETSAINTSITKSSHILVLSTCVEPVSTNRLLVFCYVYE